MYMKFGVTVAITPSVFMRRIWSALASITWIMIQRRSRIGTTRSIAS